MYKIDGTTISLVRGDSMATELTLKRKTNGEVYTPVEGDAISFAMKRSAYDRGEPILVKSVPTDTLMLALLPTDTAGLAFGEYAYEMQMTFADGTVDTFIANARLMLAPEVN